MLPALGAAISLTPYFFPHRYLIYSFRSLFSDGADTVARSLCDLFFRWLFHFKAMLRIGQQVDFA